MPAAAPGSAEESLRRERAVPRPLVVSGPQGYQKPQGTLYRGREGMWSWVAHRITGVLIFVFLLVHVLDTALVRVSPETYNVVIDHYKNPIMGLGEAGLVAAVIFHAFNGLRVLLIDFWSQGTRFQRQMLWGVLGIWVLLMVPFLIRHLGHVFGG